MADGGKVDDLPLGETNATNIKTPKSDVHAIDKQNDRALGNQFLCDSRSNQQTSKVRSHDRTDDYLRGMAGNLAAPSSTAPTVNESDSPHANDRNEGLEIMERSKSRTSDFLFCDFEDELEPPRLNAGIGFEAEIVFMSGSTIDDEPPPIPFDLHSHTFKDGQKADKMAGIVALPNISDEGAPSSPIIRFADAATKKKMQF